MTHSRRDAFFLTTLLLLMLAVAAGVRFYDLAGQSLWSDEGNSAALATRSLVQIAQDAAHDIHPPLYYWLLHLWTGVFGNSETALRSLSAALGTALVLLLAELARRLYGAATGLIVAAIAALAPFLVYYSQEARMYILLALVAVASMLQLSAFILHEDRKLRQGAGPQQFGPLPCSGLPLVIAWAAGLYTHYAFPLVIALSTGLYGVWLLATLRRGLLLRRLLRWLVLLILAAACFAPWLPTAWRQLTSWPAGGSTMDTPAGLATTLALLGLGPVGRDQLGAWQVWALLGVAVLGGLPWRAILAPLMARRLPEPAPQLEPLPAVPSPQPSGAWSPTAPVALAMAAGPAGSPAALVSPANGLPGTATHLPGGGRAVGPDVAAAAPSNAWYGLRWLIVVTWLLAPVAMMLALGLFRDAYLKFLLIASPAYALLLARGVVGPADALSAWSQSRPAGQPRPAILPAWTAVAVLWGCAALVAISLISSSALTRYFTDPRVARDDYRGIAQFIAATAQPDDAVLLDAPGQAEVFNYYYHGSLPVYPLPRQRPLDRQATLNDLDQLTRYNKVYVLYWAAQEADPGGIIENFMDNRSYKMLDQWRGNVRLAMYMMPERSAPDETADGLNLRLGSNITLLGYQAWNLSPHAGEVTQLQLAWHADGKPDRRYKVFLQLLDARDQVIAQRDAEPAGESRPTDSWNAGEVILDNHGLLIPPGTPPGTYRRILGMYDRETLQRLRLPSGQDHIDLPSITVARSPVPPPLAALDMQYNQSFDFGGIKLLGYDRYKRDFKHAPQTPLHPGDRLHLTLYWQANVQPRADWWFDMTLTDNSGHQVAQFAAPLVGPAYSTTLWEAQEIVRGEHDLALPADLPPDTYRLSLTLLPDTNTPAGVAYLGTVKVEP